MQPELIWAPANAANFMYGRSGRQVKYITFHHVVGSASSAVNKFKQASGVSAHFVVASDRIYCMVDTDNTAYTNSNIAANLESVTIEHEGDWRFGYRNEGVMANSVKLVAWLRTLYPNATFTRHRDVTLAQYPTACPGDFPVEEVWARASLVLNPPAPAPVDTRPEWLKNRSDKSVVKYTNKGNVQLWNLNDPTQPADGRLWAANHRMELGSTTTVNGEQYWITTYSTAKNIGVGYRDGDLSDKELKPVEQPPAVIETTPAPEPPVIPEPEVPNETVVDAEIPVIVAPAPQEPVQPAEPTPPVKKQSVLYELLIKLISLIFKPNNKKE